MDILKVLPVLFCLVRVGWTAPAVENMNQVRTFLTAYNYMGKNCPLTAIRDKPVEEATPMALKLYQKKMGLNITGLADNATMDMMSEPRCGMPDVVSRRDDMKRRKKRYALQGSKWQVVNGSTINYNILDYTSELPKTTIEKVIAESFQMWSEVTPLKFAKSSANTVIEMTFVTGEHGDGIPFDGAGGTLAHAFFPSSGGNVHYDNAEPFTDAKPGGINFKFVTVHELGHSLGLSHSDVKDAIMFPNYPGYVDNLALKPDDIAGIQTLYGERPKNPSSPGNNVPIFCVNTTVDAIFQDIWGHIYVFRGSQYVLLDPKTGIKSVYPPRIQDTFPGLPSDLDAAIYSRYNRHVHFFKGSTIYRYVHRRTNNVYGYALSSGFPKQLSTLSLPSDIDMAFIWSANGRAYVVKGAQYYRMNHRVTKISAGYPRNLTKAWNLPDVGSHYSAAFSANYMTYFFAGDKYVKYNDMTMKFVSGYPKETRKNVFGCTDVPEMDMASDEGRQEVTRVMTSGSNMSGVSYAMLIFHVFAIVKFVLSFGWLSI